jgi:hypothetical protein
MATTKAEALQERAKDLLKENAELVAAKRRIEERMGDIVFEVVLLGWQMEEETRAALLKPMERNA